MPLFLCCQPEFCEEGNSSMSDVKTLFGDFSENYFASTQRFAQTRCGLGVSKRSTFVLAYNS